MSGHQLSQQQQRGPLRLLCLDGGGVRGLSSLYILKHLMMTVDLQNPPKPCHFFDMMAGTSTGGIIAILLGRLEMSIDDCIDAYSNMMDKVFKKKAKRLKFNGDLQARFDTAELERCLKYVVRTYGMGKDENLLMQDHKLRCKVFVCSSQRRLAHEVVRLRTYRLESDVPDPFSEVQETAKVWEVCRATAAATSFFDPIKISCGPIKIEFLDGATRANNPIDELWDEARAIFGADFQRRLQCLVSIGNGEAGHINFEQTAHGALKALKQLTVETKRAHTQFLQNHQDLKARTYYRLNVVEGLQSIGLEEADKREDILACTKSYLDEEMSRDKLRIFKATVTQSSENEFSQDISPLAVEFRPQRQPHRQPQHISQAFLTLGRDSKWVNHRPRIEPDSYWSRLTLASLQVYAAIFKAMRDPSTGEVDAARFITYFSRLNPAPRDQLVKHVWGRLPLEGLTSASRDVTMAAIYMVHMETHVNPSFRPNFSPPNSNIFSYHRAKFIWRYANWVRCACGCGRLWNFSNGIEGLVYDELKPDKARACAAVVPDEAPSKGMFSKIFRGGAERRRDEALRLFDRNRLEWMEPQDEDDRIQIWSTAL